MMPVMHTLLLMLTLAGAASEKPPVTMRDYVIGLLRRGPQAGTGDQETQERLQREHLANIGTLWESGKLLAAGPFVDGGPLRGLFVFGTSLEEARALADTDPAVKADRLVVELHPWYGPAGIGEAYRKQHTADPSAKDEMVTYPFVLLTRGPRFSTEETPERARLMEAHLANIRRLGDEKKLLVAGPFGDDGALRGILIFRAAPLAEAQAWAETDPAVQAGRLAIEAHAWMAARGTLPE
jgi:uncharacterized protein YciI